jgi:hypothetical protein
MSDQDMFNEVNDDVSIGAVRGRTVIHVFTQLTTDLAPNFVYNSATRRFVRRPDSAVLPSSEPEREAPPRGVAPYYWYGGRFQKQYESAVKLTKEFFGAPHLDVCWSMSKSQILLVCPAFHYHQC